MLVDAPIGDLLVALGHGANGLAKARAQVLQKPRVLVHAAHVVQHLTKAREHEGRKASKQA